MKKTTFAELRAKTGLTLDEVREMTGYNLRNVYRWENGELQPRKTVITLLENYAASKSITNNSGISKFRFIDLFAGIGGMRKGFESVGGTCVFTSEWNKYSQMTYQKNFPGGHEIAGDITKLHEKEDIPEHEVLVAGFPCQPFSIAGVSKKNSLGKPHGFRCKTQGTLFFDVARIIEQRRPVAFMLENVKNLASHDGGNTFKTIMNTLKEELGYHVQARIINGNCFVPQHRERIFIVGFRDKNIFDFDKMQLPVKAAWPTLSSILHTEDGTEAPEFPYTEGPRSKVAAKYTLTPNLWEYLQNYSKKHKALGNGFGFGLFGPDGTARTLSARYHKDGSEILIKQKGKRPRRLTPRECARLMGFDQPGSKPFEIPVSDTQAYRQFGNAVVVPVVKAVAEHMLPHIMAAMKPAKQAKRPLELVS